MLTWRQVYAELFSDGTPERMDQLFRYLDKDHTGCIDFLSWSRRIRLQVDCSPDFLDGTALVVPVVLLLTHRT